MTKYTLYRDKTELINLVAPVVADQVLNTP